MGQRAWLRARYIKQIFDRITNITIFFATITITTTITPMIYILLLHTVIYIYPIEYRIQTYFSSIMSFFILFSGKMSGHGHQKSRSTPRAFEGGQTPLYKRLPKVGFHNPGYFPITIALYLCMYVCMHVRFFDVIYMIYFLFFTVL